VHCHYVDQQSPAQTEDEVKIRTYSYELKEKNERLKKTVTILTLSEDVVNDVVQ